MRIGVFRVEVQRLVQQLDGRVGLRRRVGDHRRQCAQQIVIRVEAGRGLAPRALDLRPTQRRLKRAHHALCDAVLKIEYVLEPPIEAVGPQMRARDGIDKLGGDPDAVNRATDAALQN